MEIKGKLYKPYTDKERADFIVENNHNKGYEIKESEEALEAWGKTEEEQKEHKELITKEEKREERNFLLQETDKYMIVDFPISDEDREKWVAYRQYLRDYTKQENWWEESPKTFEDWQ